MSASVDLLPPELAQRRADRRNLQAFAGVVVLVVATVLLVYAGESRRLTAATAQREAAEAELAQLSAREAALAEFGLLDRELEAAQLQLATALGAEVGFAGILQDLAAVLPTDATIDDLTIDSLVPDVAAVVQLSGETRLGIAPGLERLLVSIDKVDAFASTQLSSSTVDGEYTAFDLRVSVDEAARTNRYAEGLPEGLR